MNQRIVIIGSGFAGLWAALSAARAREIAGRAPDALEIIVVSPEPTLVIRPRLYEAALDGMAPDLRALFERVDVRHVAARVEHIDARTRTLRLAPAAADTPDLLRYDRLVLAAGSVLHRPPVPGLALHAFDVDQLDSARRLDDHLQALARRPESAARNTVVVAGGGFTGIETAAELPARLRAVFGPDAPVRVVVLERADAIGPDLGPGPRPVIEQALQALGVEVMVGAEVSALDAQGVAIRGSSRIDAHTVVWTAGAQAHPLAAQVPGTRDRHGRLHVTPELRVPDADGVYATGDTACAATDDDGHVALMSCQHAIALGRAAGHNAAASLLDLPPHPYRQPKYVTCLDLGGWGAVYTEGWERAIHLRGAEAKDLKRTINTVWIYPPQGDRASVLAAADPAIPVVA